jgi:GntR family transcriptional regulator/MocR family aminotransferase
MNTNNEFAIQRIIKQYALTLPAGSSAKYSLLYRAIKTCIIKRELPDDWIMPPTRTLSVAMNLSRTTVLKAYELLLLERLIIARRGSGNRVNHKNTEFIKKKESTQTLENNAYPEISQKGKSYLQNITLINRLTTNDVAFRPGLPPLDVFPVNQWKKLLNAYWRHIKSSGLAYSQSTGLTELKKSISNYLNVSRNLKCDPDQIVIVSGSLQSLYLIANTLINKGDAVVLEDPVFPNVHSVFKSSEAHLIPVALDSEGIDLSKLNKSKNKHPKLIHVTPSNQYPSGVRMSLKRRQELLKWASTNKALIIENDYENEIANHATSIPTIFSLDHEDRTIYMGTFNRLLHPSIRLGYMIVPEYLTNVVGALQEHSHRFVSPSIQIVMNQFIERNYLYQHIKKSIAVAEERFELFKSEFEVHCKSMYIQPNPFSSFHVVALFHDSVSVAYERKVIQKLAEIGITAFSLSKCYITAAKRPGLILGYSSVRTAVLKRKVKLMGKVL